MKKIRFILVITIMLFVLVPITVFAGDGRSIKNLSIPIVIRYRGFHYNTYVSLYANSFI